MQLWFLLQELNLRACDFIAILAYTLLWHRPIYISNVWLELDNWACIVPQVRFLTDCKSIVAFRNCSLGASEKKPSTVFVFRYKFTLRMVE